MTIVIDEGEVAKLRAFGEKNVIEYDEALKILKGEAKCAGDRQGYSMLIPTRYRLVFSIEWTPSRDFKRRVKLRRMSISVAKRDPDEEQRWIGKQALQLIATLLGFPIIDESNNVFTQIHENDTFPNISLTEVLETVDTYDREEKEKREER